MKRDEKIVNRIKFRDNQSYYLDTYKRIYITKRDKLGHAIIKIDNGNVEMIDKIESFINSLTNQNGK